jgi:hypothetical protein
MAKPQEQEQTKPEDESHAVEKQIKKKVDNNASWNFPKQTLEEALEIPKAIEEIYASNPVEAEDLAKAVGFNKSEDWRFREQLRSANMYGLVDGSGAKVTVNITELGSNIVSPISSTIRQKALMDAFLKVDLFKNVYEFYKGKKPPEDEFFINTIVKEFAVPRERVDIFIKNYKKNLEFLMAFAPIEKLDESLGSKKVQREPPIKIDFVDSKELVSAREFLDSCFVLMPFGDWFDKYYQEIYVPAIKEAGYEPIRADSLFSTGSVVEQIWEQITKAKVLIADLTGKNPNVFYELGLSHAKSKPVIFISGNLDDVPFDLRHLRVIIYEQKNPTWGTDLKKSITDYLKNAKKEPEKTIPQPFRQESKKADGQL